MGRFTSAAKYEKELGDLAKEESKIDQALLHYKKAADYYSSEDQTRLCASSAESNDAKPRGSDIVVNFDAFGQCSLCVVDGDDRFSEPQH